MAENDVIFNTWIYGRIVQLDVVYKIVFYYRENRLKN